MRWRDIGTGRTNWADVRAILSTLPHDAALSREINGDAAHWSHTDHLLALVIDTLAWANYQRGGGKGRKPKPIPRPGTGPKVDRIEMGDFDTPADFDQWRLLQLNTQR